MNQSPPVLLKNRLMWTGFGIAAGIGLLNGLKVFNPWLPAIPVGWETIVFHDKPWSYIDSIRISFQPFVMGLSFFMPLDLAFSAWFFYFLKKAAQLLIVAVTGQRQLYFDEQAQGAWVGLGILALWIGRKHLTSVTKQAGTHQIDSSREAVAYRFSFLGIAAVAGYFLPCLRIERVFLCGLSCFSRNILL